MKRLMRLIYSNKFFALLMLAVQIGFLTFSVMRVMDYTAYINGGIWLVTLGLFLYEVNRTENPNFKITWILIIALFPAFGILLYTYLHLDITTKALGEAQNRSVRYVRALEGSDTDLIEGIEKSDKAFAGVAKFLTKYGYSRAFDKSDIKYYSLGDYMIEDIVEELKKAEKFIFIESFIINREGKVWPDILEILKEKANKGVEVRVMYDGMGCLTTLPKYYEETLNSMKIKCRTFSPVQPLLSTYQNNRDHRKIMVIDGKVAFTGGINLADEYANYIERFGHWKDVGVKVTGNAVAGFTGLFLQMWNGIRLNDSEELCREFIGESVPTDGEGIVIPYGDSPLDSVNTGMRAYLDIMNHATDYVYIMTPYLVLDDEMYNAMRFAVQRGVDVRLILPHKPDKKYAFYLARTYYPQLMASGIKIYEYMPGFVHAKVCVADGKRAIVGTVNFDYRSLFLHYECAAYLYQVRAIDDICADFKKTFVSCNQITQQDYIRFNPITKVIGRVVRVLAPLL